MKQLTSDPVTTGMHKDISERQLGRSHCWSSASTSFMATRTEVYIGRKNQTPGLNVGMHFLSITPPNNTGQQRCTTFAVLDMPSNAKRISSLQEAASRFFVTTALFYIRGSVPLNSDIPHTYPGSSHPQIPRAAELFFQSLPFQRCYHLWARLPDTLWVLTPSRNTAKTM